MDNKEIKKLNKKNIIMLVIAMLLVIGAGTYAWLSYRTNSTAMVLTIGEVESMHITIDSYQINDTIVPLASGSGYRNGVEIDVDMTNNGINKGTVRLYYLINKIDSELISSNFKWTIDKSTDGTNYTYYKEGNFSSASVNNELTILEEDVPAGESYKYKVYLWLDGSNSANDTEGSVFNGELRGEILTK